MGQSTERATAGAAREEASPGAAGPPPDDVRDVPMTLQEHLAELRGRLIKMVLGVAAGMAGGLFTTDHVIRYFRAVVQRADPDARLIQTGPGEYIATYFKITLYLGIGFAMPLLVFQFIRFLAPGLTKTEKRYVYATLPFVIVSFIGGVLFASLIAIPNMFSFLLGFSKGKVENDIRIGEVLSFFSSMSLWAGVFFELPVVMFLLASLGIAPYLALRKTRKYAAIGLMIVAAVITPSPDAGSMLIVWAPMYLLYELGLILARFARPRERASTLTLLAGALSVTLARAARARQGGRAGAPA
jgi:sec-independent protein translocase protein TatC